MGGTDIFTSVLEVRKLKLRGVLGLEYRSDAQTSILPLLLRAPRQSQMFTWTEEPGRLQTICGVARVGHD